MSSETTKGWVLTAGAFQALLDRLDPSPERAGQKYEELRRRLVWLFEVKGSFEPAAHADETLNRIARRIDQGEVVENVAAYAHGVARMVLLEALRRQARERTGEATFYGAKHTDSEDADRRWACLDSCMGGLPADAREIVLDYYQDEGGRRADVRKGLAGRLGIPAGVLRARVFRIRERLEACVHECLSQERHRGAR